MTRKLTFLAMAAAATTGMATADEKVDFEKQILPILEERCMKCHREPYEDARGRIKKPKGGLRLDTPEEIIAFKNDDGEANIVPGKPDESTFVKLIMLPEDDDDVMPPEGKADHLSDEEIALVKKWITEGPTFGDWKVTKFDAEGNKVE